MSLSGWQGDVKVATTEGGLVGATVEAKVQNVSVRHGGGLKPLYDMGQRLPQEIKEGTISIGLDIEVRYVAGSVWPGRANVAGTGANTEYCVGIYPNKYVGGQPKFVLTGKFSDWAAKDGVGGEVIETLTFIGRLIAIGTI